MDLSTLVGLGGGTLLLVVSMIIAASLGIFWDLTSLLIVVFGSMFATLIRWPIDKFMGGLKAGLKTISSSSEDPVQTIETITELAQTARKESILALEKVTVENPFLAKTVQFLVDGYPPETINEMIDMEIDTLVQRHKDCRGVFEHLGESAPAFGMIGTVIGLIVIMANLSDPDAIGPGIAVALITTLYGAIIANLVYVPLASKLKYRSAEEATSMELIKEGINGISKGENPKIIRQKLESFIAPKNRQEGG